MLAKQCPTFSGGTSLSLFTSFEYVGDEIFSLDDGMMQRAPIQLVLLHLQASALIP